MFEALERLPRAAKIAIATFVAGVVVLAFSMALDACLGDDARARLDLKREPENVCQQYCMRGIRADGWLYDALTDECRCLYFNSG